jgi:integrase
VEVRPGVWKFTLTRGRYTDGRPRRIYRMIEADNETEARRLKAAIIAEIDASPLPNRTDDRDMTVNGAVEQFLERLHKDKRREARTIRDYQNVHDVWFAPHIGERRLRDVVDEALWDRLFGTMAQAGVSRSRMNHARSLFAPLFRWAKRKGVVARSPLADFELPKSKHVPRQRRPPEAWQLAMYLTAAVEVVPEVAPVLSLGATTGMRRGELVVPRRSQLDVRRQELAVDVAHDLDGLKLPKNDETRIVALDGGTVEMLVRNNAEMDARAAECGVVIAPDAFIFSLELDCSEPMPPEYVTKRVAVLKEHLGIADKRPATIVLEDQALALFRGERPQREPGRRGPNPKGAFSFDEIGRRLDRTGQWARKAVASALRREAVAEIGDIDIFDGSILGLRKFTSSELLDAGFNIKVVANRQGHSPEVLVKHYSQSRRSAERKAAEHLGRLVHRPVDRPGPSGPSL